MRDTTRDHRQGSTRMCEDETNIPIANEGPGKKHVDDSTRRILRNFRYERCNAGHQVLTTAWCRGVDEHHGLAPVEFVKHLRISEITEPSVSIAGKDSYTVSLEDVARILDFAQTAFDIRQRDGRKPAKTPGMKPAKVRGIFVAASRYIARASRITEPNAWSGQRNKGHFHAVGVHRPQRMVRRPFEPSRTDLASARAGNMVAVSGEIEWRHDVMMDIDQAAGG